MATGVALVIGSCLSLQFGAALATQLFPVFGSWGTTVIRLGAAALLLHAMFRPKVWTWTRTQWGAVTLFGLTLAGMNGFFYAGIERIPLGVAVSIEFLGPLALAAILSRRWKDGIWISLALIGIGLFFLDDVTGTSTLDPLGVLFVLIAGLFWALYILAGARASALIPGTGGLAVAVAVGTLVVLPFGAPGFVGVEWNVQLVLLCLGAALLASVIPYTLEFAALRRLPRPVFGLLLSLEPVIATIAGWMLLGQTVSALAIVAVVLVVSASAGSTATASRDQRQQPAPDQDVQNSH